MADDGGVRRQSLFQNNLVPPIVPEIVQVDHRVAFGQEHLSTGTRLSSMILMSSSNSGSGTAKCACNSRASNSRTLGRLKRLRLRHATPERSNPPNHVVQDGLDQGAEGSWIAPASRSFLKRRSRFGDLRTPLTFRHDGGMTEGHRFHQVPECATMRFFQMPAPYSRDRPIHNL